ncbi:MAG: type 4a pilus biogenesis protein PilO [SAR324 cluster bacterium]|nr:type 4a pilus biogenesis protein PilO [SAR324 cluster bacterium]
MNSASVTDIFSTIVNNNRSRQVLLAGLIVLLTLLLFHNFILSPELKSIKQLKSQILQIENSLIQVNAANNNFKKPNLVHSLEKRETALDKLLPPQWKRAELLRWLNDSIQKNGLIFEEQTLEEKTPQSLNQVLKIRLKLKGEFEQFLQFLNQLKNGPRLLVMEKLHLGNTTPALLQPKLSIEMILSAHRRL